MTPSEHSYIGSLPNGFLMSKANALTGGIRAKLKEMVLASDRKIYKEEIMGQNILVLSIQQGDLITSLVHRPNKRYVDVVFNFTFDEKQLEIMNKISKDISKRMRAELMIKQIIVDNANGQSHEVTYLGENDKVLSKILIKRRIYPLDDFFLNDFEQCIQNILNTVFKLMDVFILIAPEEFPKMKAQMQQGEDDINRMFI